MSRACSRACARGSPKRSPGMRVPVSVMIGVVQVGEGLGAADRVVAEALDAEQAPVGGEADLPQGGQVGQPFGQPEVAGVVDRGLGAQRPPFLVVLLDLGVLVVDVQATG